LAGTYRLDHVGIVVDDIEEAKRFLTVVLGLELKSEHESAATSARAAFVGFGGVDLEVLEVSDPELRARRMGGERSARIEHIGIRVDDVDIAAAELAEKGVRMSTERPYGAPGARFWFTDSTTTDGVVYQIFERPDG
jgi:catechol 2,3-dioxygenase-like lactoylglutathione lyase family enzyme